MPGKNETRRGSAPREVHLEVDGHEVELNGFVADIFQEAVVGLVRALGTDDEEGRIELTIGPGNVTPGS
jgi:hypothetical protein